AAALDVIDQQLDPGAGVHRVDLLAGAGEQARRAVLEIVTGDAGDRRVAQAHLLDRLRHLERLHRIHGHRLAGRDIAEVAAACAGVTADEEGRLAILPAFEDVRAAGFLAHGVQALAVHTLLHRRVFGAHHGTGLDPLGLALDRDLGIAGLDAQHPTAFGGESHPGASSSRRSPRV